MKKITQTENIFLLSGFCAVLYFAFSGAMMDIALAAYKQGFIEAGSSFHTFWNHTFVILYKAIFVVGLFLVSRGVFKKLSQSKLSHLQALTTISARGSILLMLLIFLTICFDATFIVGLSADHSYKDLGIGILGHIQIPIPADGPVIRIVESIGALAVISIVSISVYFLIRIYRITPSWQEANKTFPRKNKPEIAKVFLSQYFTVSILQFSGILPFAYPLQDAILPLFVYISMLLNVFIFYPRFTKKSFLSQVSLNAVVQFYVACAFAVPYLLLFSITELSLSMAFATAIPSLFVTLFVVSHAISIPYYLVRRQAITANNKLLKKVEKQDSELSLLKSQINPHFLFNSLNTVYGLALEEESPKTADGVQKLSAMMRFMLQENTSDEIPLSREINYIHDYIDFQRLRIADNKNIALDIEVDADQCRDKIAPMLLIPMIENAFKHGISMNAASWIKIRIGCHQREVSLQIQNSMHPKSKGHIEESGIGLDNVRKRLEILYPEKHIFRLIETKEHFEADIKVTLS